MSRSRVPSGSSVLAPSPALIFSSGGMRRARCLRATDRTACLDGAPLPSAAPCCIAQGTLVSLPPRGSERPDPAETSCQTIDADDARQALPAQGQDPGPAARRHQRQRRRADAGGRLHQPDAAAEGARPGGPARGAAGGAHGGHPVPDAARRGRLRGGGPAAGGGLLLGGDESGRSRSGAPAAFRSSTRPSRTHARWPS